MDEYRENVKKVQKALDQDAALIQPNPYLAQRVLNTANADNLGKGVRGMQRKKSFSMLLMLILITITLTACAGVMIYKYYQLAISNEINWGSYQQWPLEEKVSFIDTLLSEGVQLDTNYVEQLHNTQLSEGERNRLADVIVVGYFGEGHDGDLSAINIMEKDKGQFDTWSLEDKAWLSQQKLTAGGAYVEYEYHQMPGENDISPDEALELARVMLPEVYDVTLQEVLTWRTTISFVQERISDGISQPYFQVCYNIAFYPSEDCETPYYIKLSNTGTLLSMNGPQTKTTSFNQRIISLTGHLSTPEEKAEFAREIAPQIKNTEEYVADFYVYLSDIPYIMPNAMYIPEREARSLAKEALLSKMGIAPDLLDKYVVYVSLRASIDGQSETPVWYLKYRFDQCEENDNLYRIGNVPYGYVVAVDAVDGSIIICRILSESEPFSDFFE
mgnify:CR=1 FL=1